MAYLGNPYKFCIIYSVIKEWNPDDTFGNGILLFCLDGMIYPSKEIVNATLKSEFWNLKKELMNLAVDERLYTLQKEEAFTEMYKVMFPEDWECNNDYRFDISPYSFSDKGRFVYAVSDGEGIRVLVAGLDCL